MDKKKLVEFLRTKTLPILECEQDDIPVRGNAVVSGDDSYDKQIEDEILSRLNSGDIYAWFTAKITVRYHGWSESSYLGACSYASEDEFRKCEYFSSMYEEALYNLADTILHDRSIITHLEKKLADIPADTDSPDDDSAEDDGQRLEAKI